MNAIHEFAASGPRSAVPFVGEELIWPSVSVVIVNWNARPYLAECLESLRASAYAGSIETIVVDNASSDGSAEMVRQHFPYVRLVCNDANLGFAKANNIGIRHANGSYVALVNSDVRLLNDCLGRLVAYCEAHPEIGLVGPKVIGRDGRQQHSCRGFPKLGSMLCRALALDTALPNVPQFGGYLLTHWSHTQCAPVDILSGCFLVVRREALTQVGLLDERFFIYGEDMDWCKRFRKAGWSAVFVPEAEAVHYGGASSANAPIRFFIEMQRADWQYWTKHHSRAMVCGYVSVSLLHHLLRVLGHALAMMVDPASLSTRLHKARCSAACLKWMTVGRWREQRRV